MKHHPGGAGKLLLSIASGARTASAVEIKTKNLSPGSP
jgi:hypothetical protein